MELVALIANLLTQSVCIAIRNAVSQTRIQDGIRPEKARKIAYRPNLHAKREAKFTVERRILSFCRRCCKTLGLPVRGKLVSRVTGHGPESCHILKSSRELYFWQARYEIVKRKILRPSPWARRWLPIHLNQQNQQLLKGAAATPLNDET